MLDKLKEQVFQANMLLPKYQLVTFTWGNVSGIDSDRRYMVIKPSGLSYELMTVNDMVVVDMEGRIVEGDFNPSSDTPTHLYLYRQFKDIGGIVHTHSRWATSFAQAGRPIIPFGTTHADYFFGTVPCTRELTNEEVASEYEKNTGIVIAQTITAKEAKEIPAILVKNHGPFSWGRDAMDAVHQAVVLEEVAMMAIQTLILAPDSIAIPQYLSDRHYYRKHGIHAYYGQKEKIDEKS